MSSLSDEGLQKTLDYIPYRAKVIWNLKLQLYPSSDVHSQGEAALSFVKATEENIQHYIKVLESDGCRLFKFDSSAEGAVNQNPLIHIFTGWPAPPQTVDDTLHYKDIARVRFDN